jgi:hypothetical protein
MTLPLPGSAKPNAELKGFTRVGDDTGRAWLKADAVPDPIFAAIDVHKAARAALDQALDRSSILDRELPVS